ncbi:MAG TPA: hypothetical protein V6D27_04740 [Vampirovibrionales bacterium]
MANHEESGKTPVATGGDRLRSPGSKIHSTSPYPTFHSKPSMIVFGEDPIAVSGTVE